GLPQLKSGAGFSCLGHIQESPLVGRGIAFDFEVHLASARNMDSEDDSRTEGGVGWANSRRFSAGWPTRGRKRGSHDLCEILFIALAAVLCGAEGPSDMARFGRSKELLLRGILR